MKTPLLLIFFALFITISHQAFRPRIALSKSSITSSISSKTSQFYETTTVNYEDLTSGTYEFTGSVTLGGSSNSFDMVFDTTNAVTWVFSADCLDCVSSKNIAKLFTCVSPCTYMADYQDHEANYTVNGLLSGQNFNISCYRTSDTVTISGLTVSAIALYVAIKADGSQRFNGQGGIGLGNSDSNIIKDYYTQGKISDMIFSFYFSDTYNLFTFGYEEPFFGLEDYTEFEVIKDTAAWAIPLSGVLINSKVNSSMISSLPRVQFDTTLEGLAMPLTVFDMILEEISKLLGTCSITSQGKISCLCSSSSDISKFPTIGFTFGQSTRTFTLEGEDYAAYSAGNCTSNLFGDKYLETWVLGVPFLAEYYVIFDQDGQIVKIATLNPDSFESYLQDETLRICIIVIGVLVILVSVVLLLLIFKPVPVGSSPKMEKGQ